MTPSKYQLDNILIRKLPGLYIHIAALLLIKIVDTDTKKYNWAHIMKKLIHYSFHSEYKILSPKQYIIGDYKKNLIM